MWFGRPNTPYEGVQAKIEDMTIRNVEIEFDRIVHINNVMLAGEVMSKRRFKRMFSLEKQITLW